MQVNKEYHRYKTAILNGKSTKLWDAAIQKLGRENILFDRGDDGTRWVRARKHQTFGEAPFTANEIGINRAVPTTGRCNTARQPMLYLCQTRETAFREIGAQAGDEISLGRFVIRSFPTIASISGRGCMCDSNELYGIFKPYDAMYFLTLLRDNDFAEPCSKETYAVTGHIANVLAQEGIDGLAYNSTKCPHKICLAFKDDNFVKWTQTQKYKINAVPSLPQPINCTLLGARKR